MLKKDYTEPALRRRGMEFLMELAAGLALANSAILIGLMYLYSKIAAKTKAAFSIGLFVFAGLLLLQNLVTVFAYVTMAPLFGAEAMPFLSGIGALELGGLLVLLKFTI